MVYHSISASFLSAIVASDWHYSYTPPPPPLLYTVLKVHKREKFFGSDFELFTILQLQGADDKLGQFLDQDIQATGYHKNILQVSDPYPAFFLPIATTSKKKFFKSAETVNEKFRCL